MTHSAPLSAVFRLFSTSGIWHLCRWPQRLQPRESLSGLFSDSFGGSLEIPAQGSFSLSAAQLLVKMTSALQKSQCCSATSAAQHSENCSATSVFACGMLQGWGLEGWGLSGRKKAHKHKLFALVNVQMALGQAAGCPRVNRAKKFMCSPRKTGNINSSLWFTGGLSQGCPDFQKVYVFKVYVPFSCPSLGLVEVRV